MTATGGTIITASDVMIAAVTGEDPHDRRRCTSYAGESGCAGEQSWDGRSGDLLVVPDARHSLEQAAAHQREVLVAIALSDAPIDVLAERLNTTRGAL